MRQQEGVNDDKHDVQLNSRDDQEGRDEEGHHQEGASDQEDLDQEEDRCFFSGRLTFPYSVTARFCGASRRAQ